MFKHCVKQLASVWAIHSQLFFFKCSTGALRQKSAEDSSKPWHVTVLALSSGISVSSNHGNV